MGDCLGGESQRILQVLVDPIKLREMIHSFFIIRKKIVWTLQKASGLFEGINF